MSILSRFFGAGREFKEPVDPGWAHSAHGLFHRLFFLRPRKLGLEGQGGVFVIWHFGVEPQWTYVGKSKDLAASFEAALDDSDIIQLEERVGLYATWAPVREEYRDGVVNFLRNAMDPELVNSTFDQPVNADAKPVPVYAPGDEPKVNADIP